LPGSMQAGSMQVGAECRADGADCFPLLGGIMIIEVAVPDDWTPGQALAVRQLLQHALRNAQPVIALVRKDVTPDELQDIYNRIGALIRESGLEAEQARV
jgi:hypothetical protein